MPLGPLPLSSVINSSAPATGKKDAEDAAELSGGSSGPLNGGKEVPFCEAGMTREGAVLCGCSNGQETERQASGLFPRCSVPWWQVWRARGQPSAWPNFSKLATGQGSHARSPLAMSGVAGRGWAATRVAACRLCNECAEKSIAGSAEKCNAKVKSGQRPATFITPE